MLRVAVLIPAHPLPDSLVYGNLISIRLRPTRIHTEQHGSPVLAFRTAGTGVDLQHTTHLVGFLTQHIAELQLSTNWMALP